ncbi:MAG: hypothetical protein U1E51_02670 [Candidatus Binatia bacterium]|nr:hypothetical protein [Candidatus Binatia bacterium]
MSTERIYNGPKSALMDRIYDEMMENTYLPDFLGWYVLSLYLARAVKKVEDEQGQRIKELDESLEFWKRETRLATAGLNLAEEKVKELKALLEKTGKLYDEYIDFLHKANESPITTAFVHGWRCPEEDLQKGEQYKREIAALRQIREGKDEPK